MQKYDLYLKLASEYSLTLGKEAYERISQKLKQLSDVRFETIEEAKEAFEKIFSEEGVIWDSRYDRSKLYYVDVDSLEYKPVKDIEITSLKIDKTDGIKVNCKIKYLGKEPKRRFYGTGGYTMNPDLYEDNE